MFVCWLAGVLVRSFVTLFVISRKSKHPIFRKLAQVFSICAKFYQLTFSEVKVKVKVQAQNRCSESLPLGRSLRYLHHIQQSNRSDFGIKHDFQQDGGLV